MTAFKCWIYKRPEVGMSVEERNEKFLARLQEEGISQAWDLRFNGLSVLQLDKGQLVKAVSISKFLPPSIIGGLQYCLSDETYLKDFGGHDDHIAFKINPKKHPLRPFVEHVFTPYVTAFKSYYAYICSQALTEAVL